MEFSKPQESQDGSMRLPNGDVIRLTEHGEVEVLQKVESQPETTERTNSKGPSVKFKIEINGKGDLKDIAGLIAGNSFASYSQSANTPSQSVYVSPEYRRPQYDEESGTSYLSDFLDNRQEVSNEDDDDDNEANHEIVESYKSHHRKIILGSVALTCIIIAGPAIQASSGSKDAVEACAADGITSIIGNPGCFADEFFADFSAKNIFHFTPEDK